MRDCERDLGRGCVEVEGVGVEKEIVDVVVESDGEGGWWNLQWHYSWRMGERREDCWNVGV